MRRRRSVGLAARRRGQAGGARALGRDAASVAEWDAIRDHVLARARWACQACGARTGLEVHHVVKRSQGGSDFNLDALVALCHRCHAQTDAPYAIGRLIVTPLGAGQFRCEVIQQASKWARSPLVSTAPTRAPATVELGTAILPAWANALEPERVPAPGEIAGLPTWANPPSSSRCPNPPSAPQ
jgi:hypothetical protein